MQFSRARRLPAPLHLVVPSLVPQRLADQKPSRSLPTRLSFGSRISRVASFLAVVEAMNLSSARRMLLASSQAMYDSGRPLMRRILPDDPAAIVQWTHFPDKDVVNGKFKCRYFYHCHPPEEREENEHGHFHLFVDRLAMPAAYAPLVSGAPTDEALPQVVHIAALSVAPSGLPTGWFTVNRWVTDEWLYPAAAIAGVLPSLDFRGNRGDAEVNRWLTAMVALYCPMIIDLLKARDALLQRQDMSGDDRSVEITSSVAIDLAEMFAA